MLSVAEVTVEFELPHPFNILYKSDYAVLVCKVSSSINSLSDGRRPLNNGP